MKNFLVSLTAIILMIVIVCVQKVNKPYQFSDSEINTLLVSGSEVINFAENKSVIGAITFQIAEDCLTLNVAVDESAPEDGLLDIEKELKRELLHQMIDNGELEESVKIIGDLKMEVKFKKIKKAPNNGGNFLSRCKYGTSQDAKTR